MVEFPDEDRRDVTVVTDGYFERETRLSRSETASFLRDLADQIEAESELTITGDGWEIPFAYSEPIEVEVEFVDQRERELEVELEFNAPRGGDRFSVQ